ncbi:MAG: amidohydrolase family protein, partial [Bacillota bacterium]
NSINSIKKCKNKNLRHSIIHCQITTLDLIEKIKKNNILTHIQPIFLDNDVHIVESKIGKRKAKETYLYNTMDKMGIKIAFGSDSPVDKLDPILGIYCAVNRTDLSGKPEKGFLPDEKISIKKALKFYTLNSAYAQHMEDKKGSLDIGKYADFTILDKNILKIKKENIKNVKVVNTYLNGISFN